MIIQSGFADWRIMRAEELWKAYCEKENIDIDTNLINVYNKILYVLGMFDLMIARKTNYEKGR